MLSIIATTSVGIPLAAEPIFNIGPFTVTNAMFFGVLTGLVVLAVFLTAARRSTLKPRSRFVFTIETLVDLLFGLAKENFSSEKQARKHLPLLISLFSFILFANISGLLPGVGSIVVDGHISLLRSFTTDLNGTLALAILSIGTVQFYAVKELGIMGHLRHYFTNQPWKPMNLFIGLNEVLGELIRIMTLSMRLFGVIYAGEVLLDVIGQIAGAFGWAATIPIYLLEIFFSAVQAYLFMMLTTVYISTATAHSDESPEHDSIKNAKPVTSVADGISK